MKKWFPFTLVVEDKQKVVFLRGLFGWGWSCFHNLNTKSTKSLYSLSVSLCRLDALHKFVVGCRHSLRGLGLVDDLVSRWRENWIFLLGRRGKPSTIPAQEWGWSAEFISCSRLKSSITKVIIVIAVSKKMVGETAPSTAVEVIDWNNWENNFLLRKRPRIPSWTFPSPVGSPIAMRLLNKKWFSQTTTSTRPPKDESRNQREPTLFERLRNEPHNLNQNSCCSLCGPIDPVEQYEPNPTPFVRMPKYYRLWEITQILILLEKHLWMAGKRWKLIFTLSLEVWISTRCLPATTLLFPPSISSPVPKFSKILPTRCLTMTLHPHPHPDPLPEDVQRKNSHSAHPDWCASLVLNTFPMKNKIYWLPVKPLQASPRSALVLNNTKACDQIYSKHLPSLYIVL